MRWLTDENPTTRALRRCIAGQRLSMRRDERHSMSQVGSIDGATKMLFKAYPGVFASVMDGLEGLMRMPGG